MSQSLRKWFEFYPYGGTRGEGGAPLERCAGIGRGGPFCLGLWTDDQVESYRPMIDFCRRHGGAKLGIQLQHSGRKGSVAPPFENNRFLGVEEGGWTLAAPSPIAYPKRPEPRQMDGAEIAGIVADYAAAAGRESALGMARGHRTGRRLFPPAAI
jgi:2,4-dienoyl-CoA reductase-like NADH-dependent reductase (Old Yellow Enzyme family)